MLLAFGFASLVLWLRYDGLPHVDRHRDRIVASIEKATGMAVSMQAIAGGWDGLRPSLSFAGFRLADRHGKAALAFERAEVTLSWWSLLRGRLDFSDVDLHGPDLTLRRAPDGVIYLADKPLNAPEPEGDGAFTGWLLSQPSLDIYDARLAWTDEMTGAPEVKLRGVEISLRQQRGRHQVLLVARPPGELASRIEARLDARFTREGTRWRAEGELYAEALQADLARLRAHLPVPETLRSGVGSLRVWLTYGAAGVKDAVADLNMRDATAQLASDALPLDLAAVSGRASYRVLDDGFELATRDLRFRLAGGDEVRPGNFSIARHEPPGGESRTEVRADGIDLKIAAALLDYFPVPRDVKQQVSRFAPRGRISEATVTWAGPPEALARSYAVKGRFEDLAINAVDDYPGVSGLTGRIEGSQAGGTLDLDSRNAALVHEAVFAEPVHIDRLEGQARWRQGPQGLEVAIEGAHFANADAEGRFAGSWHAAPAPDPSHRAAGVIDVRGTLERAEATRVFAYLPVRLEVTRDWLERSIEAGQVHAAAFELKGNLAEFPWGAGRDGHFLVEARVEGGRLRYHPDWPPVRDIVGRVRFENRGMEIRAESATIFGSRVRSASAVIADFGGKPPVVVIEGDVDTTGADGVRFLRESPLVNGPGAFTRVVSVEGPGRLKLRLDYPLGQPMRVAGEYTFSGATASVGRALAFREIQGRLAFTERGVKVDALTGTIFGRPATLAMGMQEGRVVTTVAGEVDAAALAPWLPASFARKVQGSAPWNARLVSGKEGSELVVSSPLEGLAVDLPAPFAKAAGESRPLSIAFARLGEEGETITASLAGGVHGRFGRAPAGGGWQAAVRFGAPVSQEPVREGLWLYGELPALDVDAWQAVFAVPRAAAAAAPAPQAPAPRPEVELRGVDLKLASVRYLGRDVADLSARLERQGPEWRGTLESPAVAGEVRWNPEGRGALSARLARLSLKDPDHAPSAPPDDGGQGDLPALDVAAERFEFRGRWLGALELRAQPRPEEWTIERLDIRSPNAHLASSGGWRRTAGGSITTLTSKLEVENLNGLLGQFGYGDYLKRGSGSLEGTLAWPGLPHDFALASLAGQFRVEAKSGQFAKIEPGAGKLLGLLSLQSLPRRATFDFRDVFSEGFAFERIAGQVKLARGVLLTDDFEISGPSAFVSINGEVSLPAETQSLTLRVVPEVGEGMALAATFLGTPVLGLSTLIVSKLLRNPLGKVVAYEYQVTGSWDNPVVARTSAPPPPPAAAPAKAATLPAPDR